MGGKRGKRDEECENSDRETLNHAMHHVGCMISPELNVVQDRVQGKPCTMLGSGQARGHAPLKTGATAWETRRRGETGTSWIAECACLRQPPAPRLWRSREAAAGRDCGMRDANLKMIRR